MGLDLKEGLSAGGILALILGALTALFKYGIPALRNGKSGEPDSNVVRLVEKELDALEERLIKEIRDSAQGIVARVDLNAREREADARDAKRA